MASFSPKDPTEIITIGFNLSPIVLPGENVTSATFVITTVTGTDATPASLLLGAAILSYEPLVRQNIQAGTASVTYQVRCTANTDQSRTYVETALIQVRTA